MRLAAALVLALLAAPAAANQVGKAPIGTGGTVALDTGSVGGVATYDGNTATISVTTAAANEVLYCDTGTAANSGFQNVNISDTGSHTWTLRGQFTHTSNVTGYNDQTINRYRALITAAGTNTVSISNIGIGADAVLANCYAFSGVLTTAPDDPNTSLPATAVSDTSGTPTVSGISTTTSNDALVASYFAVNPSGGISTPCAGMSSGTGFTTVTSLPFDGASGQWYCLWTQYRIVSGTLSSSTAPLGSTWPHSSAMADGVQP